VDNPDFSSHLPAVSGVIRCYGRPSLPAIATTNIQLKECAPTRLDDRRSRVPVRRNPRSEGKAERAGARGERQQSADCASLGMKIFQANLWRIAAKVCRPLLHEHLEAAIPLEAQLVRRLVARVGCQDHLSELKDKPFHIPFGIPIDGTEEPTGRRYAHVVREQGCESILQLRCQKLRIAIICPCASKTDKAIE